MWKQSARLLPLCSRSLSAGGSRFWWLQQPLPVVTQVVSLSSQAKSVSGGRHLHHQSSSLQIDLDYRSPTERIWPASPRQQKVGSRVLRALEYALSEPPFLETLVKQYGVCVEEVRMAPDMLTAYILWSAHPECENAAQNELQSRLSKIRVSVGKALKARHVPKLEFRLNQLSAAQEAVEQELNRLEEKGIDG